MAGEIQLNSTTMATESSGTITLSNVNSATNRTNLGLGSMATQNANAVALTGGSLTGTEIDLKSSGTTIYKSDGTTAVLSESGGVITLNNVQLGDGVNPNNSYAYYTMADTAGTGTSATVQFSSVTTVLEDSDFYSSSFASNTLTITIAKAGHYKISNSFYNYGSANIPTYRYYALITGTTTKYGLSPAINKTLEFDSGSGQAVANAHNNITLTFLISATVSQTIIIEPHFVYTLNSGTYYYGSNIEIQRVK